MVKSWELLKTIKDKLNSKIYFKLKVWINVRKGFRLSLYIKGYKAKLLL